mgnify:CR=1 FL=1
MDVEKLDKLGDEYKKRPRAVVSGVVVVVTISLVGMYLTGFFQEKGASARCRWTKWQ